MNTFGEDSDQEAPLDEVVELREVIKSDLPIFFEQ